MLERISDHLELRPQPEKAETEKITEGKNSPIGVGSNTRSRNLKARQNRPYLPNHVRHQG